MAQAWGLAAATHFSCCSEGYALPQKRATGGVRPKEPALAAAAVIPREAAPSSRCPLMNPLRKTRLRPAIFRRRIRKTPRPARDIDAGLRAAAPLPRYDRTRLRRPLRCPPSPRRLRSSMGAAPR